MRWTEKTRMYILTGKKNCSILKLNDMQGLIARNCSVYRVDSSVRATPKQLSYSFRILQVCNVTVLLGSCLNKTYIVHLRPYNTVVHHVAIDCPGDVTKSCLCCSFAMLQLCCSPVDISHCLRYCSYVTEMLPQYNLIFFTAPELSHLFIEFPADAVTKLILFYIRYGLTILLC